MATSNDNKNAQAEDVITKQLLTEVLQTSENGKDVFVKSFLMTNVRKPGADYGTIPYYVRVFAVVDGTDTEKHLVAKLPNAKGHLGNVSKDWNLFKKEDIVYSELIPAMNRMQSEAIRPIELAVPKVFKCVDNELSYVIMEDCSKDGYEIIPNSGNLDFDHCKLVVEEIAKFHALSIALGNGSAENLRSSYEVLFKDNYFSKSTLDALFIPMTKYVIETCHRVFARFVNDANRVNRVKQLAYLDVENLYLNSVKPDKSFNVLCHADLNPQNIFYKYDKGNPQIVTDLKLIDFQTVRFGSPVAELVYFIFPNTTTSFRNENIELILKAYHEMFVSCLQNFNFESQSFTFETLLEQFHNNYLFGLLMKLMCSFFYSPVIGPPDLPAICRDLYVEADKSCDAIVKAGAEKEIVDSLNDAIERGFL